ncbi:unnamed protein product, partial [Effrenium voratum]
MKLQALEALAAACKARRNPSDAVSCAKRLSAAFAQEGLAEEEGQCSYILASIHHELQDLEAALPAAEEALRCFEAANRTSSQAKAQSLLATLRLESKDFQEALEGARRAALLCSSGRVGREILLTCINTQALALAQLGSFAEALQFLEEQLRQFRSAKDKQGEGRALFMMAQLLQAKGSEEALGRLALAAPLLLESRDRQCEAQAWQLSARIHLEKNDLKKALPAAEMSLAAFRQVGDRRGRAQVAALLAEIQFSLCGLEQGGGSLEEALRAAKESVSLFQDVKDRSVELGYSLHCLANINLALHDWDAALRSAEEALDLFQSLHLPLLETTALLLQSGAFLGAKDFERSRQKAMEALEIYKSAGAMKGAESVDEWLRNLERYATGELNLKTFHGFSMRRKYTAPVAQADERQSIRQPRKLSALQDIDVMTADNTKATRSYIVSYQGLEHRSGVASQQAPA